MNDKDFYDWGREIGERINQFVNSGEIRELQENIRETVESTVDGVRRSVQEAMDYAGRRESGLGGKREPEESYRKEAKRQLPVCKKPEGRVSGTLMEVFGTCGAVIGWTSALIGWLLTSVSIDLFGVGIGAVSCVFAAVAAGACTIAAVVGGICRRRAGRFKKYVRAMGERDFYSVEGLARTVRKKEKFVVRDLKEMMRRGWFFEGHLDDQETCFMLTDESYGMYLEAQEQLRKQKEEEERMAAEKERLEQDPVRRQLRLTVEEGNEYIRRIREINDAIAEQEISDKLKRLENVCGRIFGHIGEKPEKLPDIRKFMSYYLPTTLKLAERYLEFHSQPVQGENITTAKQEIEDMLDDINGAFEKMFDRLFEEEALDISTDITVLSTMLAQEGLLEDEWKGMEKDGRKQNGHADTYVKPV